MLDREAEFPVFGLPVRIRSNRDEVLELAEAAFGHWTGSGLAPPRSMGQAAGLRVSVLVEPGAAFAKKPGHRLAGQIFLAAHPEALLIAHLPRGTGLAFVRPQALADGPAFRHHVLECLVLLLASRQGRLPLHAASVVRGERALLFTGASKSGKSTLGYACVRAGFELLAEDVTYLGAGRVWGHSTRMHLLPDAVARFPELAGLEPRLQPNGKIKLALSPQGKRLCAEQAILCMLRRHGQPASWLEAIPPAEAWASIERELEPGFDLHREAYSAHPWTGPAYTLHLGTDLDAAVRLLISTTDAAAG